jgi:predicted nuclease of predicted toxin-antitoxin system
MLEFLADENFNGEVYRGLLRFLPGLDLVRVQDVGLQSADDPAILEWAATHGRIVLTHDRATFPDFAYYRIVSDTPMPGLFVVSHRMPIRQAIDELLVVIEESQPEDWKGRVLYFPLQ